MQNFYTNTHNLSLTIAALRLKAIDPLVTISALDGLPKLDGEGKPTDELWKLFLIESSLDYPTIDALIQQPEVVADKWAQIRAERQRLLQDCDWTQLGDAALTLEEKQAWTAYRQALRNIPQEFDFPEDVVFPKAPGEE